MRFSILPAASRVRRRPCRVVRLSALAAGMWVFTSVASAAPAVPAAAAPAASTAPGAIEGRFVPATPRPFLAVSLSGSGFADEDLRSTYGVAPAVGLWFHINDGPPAQYFLGIQYCSKRGDVFYDDPVFESSGSAKLVVMPVEFGLRTNLRRGHRTALFLGFAAEYSLIWETVRGAYYSNPSASETIHAWGLGFRVLAGPEFDFGRGPWVMGAEFSAGRHMSYSDLDVGSDGESGHDQRTVELTGLALRGYLGRRL